MDPQREHQYEVPFYESLGNFPQDDAHIYEASFSGLIIPTEPQPPGNTESTDRPMPVRPPPLPPRTRLPSACLPEGPGKAPPPVPPRRRVPLGMSTKQFSCDFTEPAQKLNRSRTEIENHVSISCSFSLSRNKELFLWFNATARIDRFFFPPTNTSGPLHHQSDRHSTGQHQESGFFLRCNFKVRERIQS